MWSAHGQQVGLWTVAAVYRSQRMDTFWMHSGVDGPMLTAFPKSAAYGESSVQQQEHGEMICGRCFRVHSNRPGDAEEDGEALLKRATSKG